MMGFRPKAIEPEPESSRAKARGSGSEKIWKLSLGSARARKKFHNRAYARLGLERTLKNEPRLGSWSKNLWNSSQFSDKRTIKLDIYNIKTFEISLFFRKKIKIYVWSFCNFFFEIQTSMPPKKFFYISFVYIISACNSIFYENLTEFFLVSPKG